jgi:glycosyltransferase involved in cell wall biosynthesis
MNILFLTILKVDNITDRGVYSDLMRKFQNEGHNVFIVTPLERRYKQSTILEKSKNVSILKINTFNIQKTNALEKWFAIYFMNFQFLRGIKKYFSGINFNLVIYSTPPITFTSLVNHIKKKDGAVSYLLLKDIFPQNAVDLGLISKGGLLHNYFLRKEKRLYEISDYIGCMSQANVDYLKEKNPEIDPEKIEINPNSHELFDENISIEQKKNIRNKYKIPANAIVFIYGGNLGKPQGISFILDFLDSQKKKPEVFFLVVGSGTEYKKIKAWFDQNKPQNELLLSELPKHDYNLILKSSDAGMIFLDKRFTVPNFPSRLLSFLEYKLPVVAATDKTTDLGKIIMNNNFGLWSESGDLFTLDQNIDKLVNDPELRERMGKNGHNYFLKNYTVDYSYNIMINHFNRNLNNS